VTFPGLLLGTVAVLAVAAASALALRVRRLERSLRAAEDSGAAEAAGDLAAREALDRTRHQLAEAQRIAHLGSWEYVAATRSTVWSDEEKRIYGLDPSDPSPDYEDMLRNFIHHEDAAELDRLFRSAFEQGVAFANENRIVRPDGSVRWIANQAQPYFDEQGALVRYIGTTLDITLRKQADALQERLRGALTVAVEEWRRTFDAMDSAILILDGDGNVVRLNECARRVAGVPFAACIGRRVTALPGEGPWSAASDVVAELRSERTAFREAHEEPDGRWWQLAATRTEGAPAERHTVLVARDVTDVVALRQAARRAEQMAALGSLTAGLAHEVRNPLFAISATIDALGAELEERPGIGVLLADAQREVERLGDLMKELLDYGKPNVAELCDAPLGSVVDAAARSCAALAVGAGVTVERLEVASPLVVRLDRRRLEQVIENLLENAIQHAPQGSAVWVDLESFREGERAWARCRVSDTGPGISPTDLDKVFEPFFTRRPNGTGLGLSIAQQIVEQHGGRIRAGNRPGGGAVLTVEVPCSTAPAEPAEAHARIV
jgi:PAS domain S-box-containing protein